MCASDGWACFMELYTSRWEVIDQVREVFGLKFEPALPHNKKSTFETIVHHEERFKLKKFLSRKSWENGFSGKRRKSQFHFSSLVQLCQISENLLLFHPFFNLFQAFWASPFHNLWFGLMYLWPTYKIDANTLFATFPWGTHCYPQCYSKCFCFHC